MRRFPAPWTVEALDGGFKIVDSNGQTLAYVYGHADPGDAQIAKGLSLDEARRIASNIAKLPKTRPVCKRIRLARTKAKKLLGHFLYLAALHENNAIVVFSSRLASQIPRSYAANAFNWFQRVMHDFEIVRLCALWDSAGDDRAWCPLTSKGGQQVRGGIRS